MTRSEKIELVGAAAVLMGLIFVGLELRQNTSAVQASTLQGMVDLSSNYLFDSSRDPEIIALISKAFEGPAELGEIESQQMRILLRSQWFRYQGAFRHWQRGSLGPDDWEVYERFICADDAEGSFATVQAYYWPTEKHRFIDEFVSYVEACRPDLASAIG